MKTLIVTGGIGSGKSLVCSYLAEKGIPVYDSDSRTKFLYYENPLVVMDIEDAVGVEIRDEEGNLDRKKLGAVIFKDSEKRVKVEEIVHPMVFEDFIGWRNDHFDEAPYVVMESAIFLEKPLFHSLANAVILVEAPLELRVERAAARDGASREAILLRAGAQSYNPDLVDVTIINDSDIKTLYSRVDEALMKIGNKLI